MVMVLSNWLAGVTHAQPTDGLFRAQPGFNVTNRLVSVSVFQWFTATGGQLTGPWRPLEGRANWTGTTEFWRAQIKQMMAANFDVLYVHLIPSSEDQRVNLFRALNQLRREGWNVPKVAPFLDPMITWNQQPPVNVATAAGKDTFVSQYIRWFNQYYSVNQDAYADDFIARIGGRPVLDTWHVKFNLTNLTALSRADVETRLRNTFAASHPVFNDGIYMVTTALNDPTFTWADEKVPQFEINQYFYAHVWNGRRAVQLKGGYWDQNIRNPGDFLPRNGGLSYSNAWRNVNRSLLSRVYVESWNEYDEGTGIYAANPGAPYIRTGSGNTNTDVWSRANDPYEYIKATARGAAAFNDWPERDAKMLWHDLPVRMMPGETRTATVIVRNEGDALWSEAAKYRFGQKEFLDPVLFGAGRYLINDTQDDIPTFGGIFRGRAKTFTLTLRAPAHPGLYTNHWSMVQENVTWFGPELVWPILVDPTPLFHGTPQAIDSTGLFTNQVDDFTEHTYAARSIGVGNFAECPITRTFAAPIKSLKVSIVSGTADDIGYVGEILVTPDSANVTCRLGHVTNTVDVTRAVAVSGNTVNLTLRAKDTCCCDTGWGEDTAGGRSNARLRWQVELAPPVPISQVLSNTATGHYYVLLSPATWTWSERAAVALGGHLTSIGNEAELNWVFERFGGFANTNRLLWIGLNDVAKEGSFVWSSGEPVNFTFWANGEPNNALGGEDFVTMYQPGHAQARRWNDWGERVFVDNRPFNGVLELVAPMGPPVIRTQPRGGRVNPGSTFDLSVGATGSPVLAYQWRFNGTNLAGATRSTLTLTNVQFGQSGNYFVRITNALGVAESANARLTINHAPVANSQTVSLDEDTSVGITLTGTDVDGDALTFTVLTQPTRGQLSGVAPALVYTPNTNYNGADRFTFKLRDGLADSPTGIVSINVRPVNDPPLAHEQALSVNEDTSLPISLSATDVDGDALTWSILSPPAHGSLSGTAPQLTYLAATNYFGPDGFAFKVNDGHGDSEPARVSLTVNPVNDPPVAHAQSLSVNEDTSLPITLTAFDVEGDPLTWTIVSPPAHGSLSGTAPNLAYLAATNYHGPDSFTFKVNDGQADSAAATASIAVNPVNDPPVADAQSVSVDEDTALPISLTASDVDGDPLTWSVVTPPAHGGLSGTAPNLTYLPATNYFGPDSFTFKVNDGQVDSEVATMSITVNSVNDAPFAVAEVAPLFRGTGGDTNLYILSRNNTNAAVIFDGSKSWDVENDPLTFAWFEFDPAHPLATGVRSTNFLTVGVHIITLVVSDGPDTGTARVTFEVIPPSRAVAQIYVLLEDADISPRNPQPLYASLNAAMAAFERGNFTAALNTLEAFINKVQAQITPVDPALATALIVAAQQIIDVIRAAGP